MNSEVLGVPAIWLLAAVSPGARISRREPDRGVGAVYLIYLGVGLIRAQRRDVETASGAIAGTTLAGSFRMGQLVLLGLRLGTEGP